MWVRFLRYAQHYGWGAATRHALIRAYRSLIPPVRRLFRADLAEAGLPVGPEDPSVEVRPYRSFDQIPSSILQEILAVGTIDDRRPYSAAMIASSFNWLFAQGALFWACQEKARLVGYLWSIRGTEDQTRYHFVPLGPREAVFLAHEVFPAYRGRGLNGLMTHLVMGQMRAAGVDRVYVDVELSNRRSLKSFSKTAFVPIGQARMKRFGTRQIVIWSRPEPGENGPPRDR